YDTSRPLIIDPVLAYSTYLGGSGGDQGAGIAVDTDGNAYVMGTTSSTNFPTTAAAFQPGINEGLCSNTYTKPVQCSHVFVTKLNPAGSALVYSTYLGGSGPEVGSGIAVDASGNAYVTGQTEGPGSTNNLPATPGAFQSAYAGGVYDAFVTKLNPAGSALVYSTFLGGASARTNGYALDAGSSIAIDSDGNAYVTGSTDSTDFPTTAGAFQTTYRDCSCEFPPLNAFVTKLDP